MATQSYRMVSQDAHPDDNERRRRNHPIKTLAQASGSLEIVWFRKLSILTVATMLSTNVLIVAAVGFLCFLWWAPHGNELWRRIVSNGYAARSVTITALVIRNAVSAQAAFTTSMLACIVLERSGVVLHAVASVSNVRNINNGPQSLLFALKNNLRHCWMTASSTLLILCTTLLLQFTSTALIADFGTGTLTSTTGSESTLVAMSYQNLNATSVEGVQSQYWAQNLQNFPTFAELHEGKTESDTRETIRDTGSTLRAFLPFSNTTQRTSINYFAGAATVVDSRVVCVRPEQHAGLSVAYTDSYSWQMNGTLSPDPKADVPGLILSGEPASTRDKDSISFDIGSETTSLVNLKWSQDLYCAHDTGSEWNLVEKLMYHGPGLISSLDPRYPDIVSNISSDVSMSGDNKYGYGPSYYVADDSIPLMTGRSYVLLNMTISANVPESMNSTVTDGPKNFFFSQDQDFNKLIVSPQNEWLEFTIPRVPGWRAAVTLCYDSFTSIDASITATTDYSIVEPVFSAWDTSTRRFGTKDIRQQLAALDGTEDDGDRGVLNLHTTANDLRKQVQVWYNESKTQGWSNISYPSQNLMRTLLRDKTATGRILCLACDLEHPDSNTGITWQSKGLQMDQILQDVVVSTKNIALGLQTYYTVISRLAYYNMLFYFDVPDQPSVARFQIAQFPKESRGLLAVILVLCVHLLLVGLVVLAFLIATRVSRIGDNAWQSLAQAHSSQTQDLLRSSTMMRDDDVKEWLAADEKAEYIVTLGPLEETGVKRIGLRKRNLKNKNKPTSLQTEDSIPLRDFSS